MIGFIPMIAVVAAAIAAGLGSFSFWWVLIPVFFAGLGSLANASGYRVIQTANEQGRLGVFPALLAFSIGLWLAAAGAIFWITSALSR